MLTTDRKRDRNPVRTRPAELKFGSRLKKIAEHCGTLINGFEPGDPSAVPGIQHLLDAYATQLRGWAINTASAMLMDVALRDEQSWMTHARDLSTGLRNEIKNAPTGEVMRSLLAEQVDLIQSIPREAGNRVSRLTLELVQQRALENISNSSRSTELVAEIMRSGEVAKSRAVMIARTETARTASVLTQARALNIGCTHAIWRTSHDSDVRPAHREMEGKVFALDDPPQLSDGTKTFPGQIFNCRCYMTPILPK